MPHPDELQREQQHRIDESIRAAFASRNLVLTSRSAILVTPVRRSADGRYLSRVVVRPKLQLVVLVVADNPLLVTDPERVMRGERRGLEVSGMYMPGYYGQYTAVLDGYRGPVPATSDEPVTADNFLAVIGSHLDFFLREFPDRRDADNPG